MSKATRFAKLAEENGYQLFFTVQRYENHYGEREILSAVCFDTTMPGADVSFGVLGQNGEGLSSPEDCSFEKAPAVIQALLDLELPEDASDFEAADILMKAVRDARDGA